jgi:hypothetical protein
MDMTKNVGGGVIYDTIAYCNSSEQFITCTSTDNAVSKAIKMVNNPTGSGTLSYSNTADASHFIIQSDNTALDLITPSNDITLASGKDIVIQPNTSSGNLIFTGSNLQATSSTGSSGQYLVINLNGTTFKIPLDSA